nr:ABC transporter ATP-binding protein [Psychromonas sp. B3M02]
MSLTVQSGELVAVVGLNGAGKTRLLRCLYCVNKPSSGEVLLDGEKIWSLTARHCAQRIATALEDSNAEFALTVFEMGLISKSTHWKRTSSDIIAIDNHSSGYWKINIT